MEEEEEACMAAVMRTPLEGTLAAGRKRRLRMAETEVKKRRGVVEELKDGGILDPSTFRRSEDSNVVKDLRGEVQRLKNRLVKEEEEADARLRREVERGVRLGESIGKLKQDEERRESDFSRIEDENKDLRERLKAAEERSERQREAYADEEGEEIVLLRRERAELSDIAQELEHMKILQSSTAMEAGQLKKSVTELQEQLAEAEARSIKAQSRAAELEAEVAEAKLVGCARQDEDSKAGIQELTALRAEVLEARRLRTQWVEREALQEQLLDAQAKVQRLQGAAAEAESLRARCDSLEAEVANWKDSFRNIPGVSNGDDIPSTLVALQAESKKLVQDQGELKVSLAGSEAARAAADRRRVSAENAAAAARSAEIAASAALKRMERKTGLLVKERDGLKRILASYDDETIGQEGTPMAMAGALQQLKEAEVSLTDSRAQIESLEAEMSAEVAMGAKLRDELKREKEVREGSDTRIKLLEGEVETLTREIESLERRVGRGEYDPRMTKVLHLARNPESQAMHSALEKEIEVLREENNELVSQVKRLEASQSSAPSEATGKVAGPTGGAVSSALTSAEVTILKRRVSDLEKREVRYKGIFKDQISAFREACYFLFGFRINMAVESAHEGGGGSGGQKSVMFVIRSMFASEGESEDLVFKYRAGEGVEMIDSPFSSSSLLEPMVKTFVRQFKCIPAFTANLTIENFNKTTIS